MIRGTTPTHTFTLPFETSILSEAMIVYAQDEKEILNKKTDACTLTGNEIVVTLTQEDTFLFDHKKDVQIQIRVLTKEGVALASQIFYLDVEKCLNSEVIG